MLAVHFVHQWKREAHHVWHYVSRELQEYRPVFITVNWDTGPPDANINLPSPLPTVTNKGVKKKRSCATRCAKCKWRAPFPLNSLVMCSKLRVSPGWYKSKNPRKHIPVYRVQCIPNTVFKKSNKKIKHPFLIQIGWACWTWHDLTQLPLSSVIPVQQTLIILAETL